MSTKVLFCRPEVAVEQYWHTITNSYLTVSCFSVFSNQFDLWHHLGPFTGCFLLLGPILWKPLTWWCNVVKIAVETSSSTPGTGSHVPPVLSLVVKIVFSVSQPASEHCILWTGQWLNGWTHTECLLYWKIKPRHFLKQPGMHIIKTSITHSLWE